MEKEQSWDQDLEEVEEEEDSLKVRRSRAHNEGSPMEMESPAAEEDSAQLKGSGRKTNGHKVQPSESENKNVVEKSVLDEYKEKDGPENAVAPAGTGVHKETEITEGHSKSDSCVYHDKDEEHIKQSHGGDALGITAADFGAQKNLNSVIAYEYEDIQKNVDLSFPQHSKILPEEYITSYSSSKVTEIETVGTDHVDESDLEGAELDVETVLQKQNTHDLYCPNCNSCITRRVILRKRKRRIRINSEDIKRNKLETISDSTAKDSDRQATSGQGTSDIHLDGIGTSELAANDFEREREPHIFRCLSCFSIFIPTGKGFKLFQIFGDKGKKDAVENQQISSTFLTDRDGTIAESGSRDTQKTSSREHMPSSNLKNLNGADEFQGDGDKALPSSVQQQLMHEKLMPGAGNISYDAKTMNKGKGFKLFQIFGDKGKKDTVEDQQMSSTFLTDRDGTIAEYGSRDSQKTSSREHMPSSNLENLNGAAEFQGDGDKALPSSVQQQLMHEKLMPGAGNISYDAKMMNKDAGDEVKKTLEAASENQPITSNVLNDIADVSTNRTPAPKAEPQSDTISVYQSDGLKLLISTNVGSTTREKLQEDQKPDLKIQNIHADMESISSMPPKVSEHKGMDVNRNTITQVEVFHELEQHDGTRVAYKNGTQDKLNNNDEAQSYELPQQTIDKKNVEIHAGEHLKINKDALVFSTKKPILIHDKQAHTVKDLKKMIIDHHAGKDTVIVVEAGPSKTTDSQFVQDSNASAETGTLPHLATDMDVVDQMGADAGEAYEIEIIKSIVYGGLVESITSLGVVSSAAGGGTSTLNILALAMANLIGGLVVVGNNLREVKKSHVVEVPNQDTAGIDRYKELLGRRENFVVHATVAVLSFILFGLISPITYAFSFQKSDNRDFKLLSAAAASLLCIALLGTGKAYVRKPPKSYFKTVCYYIVLGFAASGISYAAGELVKSLLEKFHVLQSNSLFAMPITQTRPDASLWASY